MKDNPDLEDYIPGRGHTQRALTRHWGLPPVRMADVRGYEVNVPRGDEFRGTFTATPKSVSCAVLSGAAFLYVGEIAGLHTERGLGVSRLALSLVLTSLGSYIAAEKTLDLADTALCGVAMWPLRPTAA